MATYRTPDGGEIALFEISGHPGLYRDDQPSGQHDLFGDYFVCGSPRRREVLFPVEHFGDCCNHCLNHLGNSRLNFSNDEFERGRDYEAWQRELDPPSMSKPLRAQVFARDGYACRYCGIGGELAIYHVHPQSRGGKHILSNLVSACRTCNSRKHDRTPEEVGMPRRPIPKAQA